MIMALCDNAEVLNIVRIIKIFITIIKIAVPILLLVTGMITYLKAVSSGDLQKPNKALINKVVAAIIIFFIPTIVSVIINLVAPDSDINQCIENATSENIANVKIEETYNLIDKIEENFSISTYNAALAAAKEIEDSNTREEVIEKIKEYEEYIDLSKDIDKLAQNYNRTQFRELYEEVENIDKSSIKEKLLEKIEEIGDKPLQVDPGTYKFTLDGLSYKVYISNCATYNMPLIMYLHGDGGNEGILYSYVKKAYGDDYPFILVAPIGGMWAETSGRLAILKKIADKVCSDYSCDETRISISGHSRGAIGTWAMVNSYPNYFYSAVPVSCGGGISASNFKNTKVKAFCGNRGDDLYYYNNMLANATAIYKAGGDATFIELNAGHSETPGLAFTKETLEWMIE